MPTTDADRPLFATVDQLETDHRILNAAARIKRWGLEPVGTFHPSTGRSLDLYSVDAVLEKTHAH